MLHHLTRSQAEALLETPGFFDYGRLRSPHALCKAQRAEVKKKKRWNDSASAPRPRLGMETRSFPTGTDFQLQTFFRQARPDARASVVRSAAHSARLYMALPRREKADGCV